MGRVSPDHPTRRLGEYRKLPKRGPPKMDWILCIFEVRKKLSGTPFSVFLSDDRALQTSRGPGLFSLTPLDGPEFSPYEAARRFRTGPLCARSDWHHHQGCCSWTMTLYDDLVDDLLGRATVCVGAE